jgi:hypothetical protein
MQSLVTIPANLTPQLRNGVHHVLGDAAKEVSTVVEHTGRPSHPELYTKPVARFKQTCELLDLIGWGNPPEPAAIHLDLREHHAALRDALDVTVRLADIEVDEIEDRDAARALRHEPSLRESIIARALALHELNSTIIDIAASIDAQS